MGRNVDPQALSNDRVTGSVGEINTAVDLTRLFTAIKCAAEAGVVSRSTQTLVWVARLVLQLRQGVRSEDWPAVSAVLSKLDDADADGGSASVAATSEPKRA